MTEYWEYSLDSDKEWNDGGYDYYTTPEQAYDAACDEYEERCAEGEEFNYDQRDTVTLFRYTRDDDLEPTILETRTKAVEYAYQRPDREEHGTWYHGGCL